MAQLKTRPTRKSVTRFLESVEHDTRREDARELLKLFKRVTGKRPVMWCDSIVGFGSYHYRQKSGQEADWPLTGFSPRKQSLSVYIMPGFATYGKMLAGVVLIYFATGSPASHTTPVDEQLVFVIGSNFDFCGRRDTQIDRFAKMADLAHGDRLFRRRSGCPRRYC